MCHKYVMKEFVFFIQQGWEFSGFHWNCFFQSQNKSFYRWGVGQTGLNKIILQKSCYIPTLVVSECPKNPQNPNSFLPHPQVHVSHFALRLAFLIFSKPTLKLDTMNVFLHISVWWFFKISMTSGRVCYLHTHTHTHIYIYIECEWHKCPIFVTRFFIFTDIKRFWFSFVIFV